MIRFIVAFILLFSYVNSVEAQKSILTHVASNEKKGDNLFYYFAYKEALDAYKAALDQNPDEGRIILKIADTYRLLNEPEQSSEYYKKVMDNDEVVESKHKLHYAQSLSASGKYEKAKVWYEKYKTEVGDDSRSERNLQRIEKLSELLKDSLSYHVSKLNINSKQADFSPTFYNEGIVFVSSREPEKGIKPVFNWNDSHFLDLYYSIEHEDGTNAEPELFHRNVNTKLHEGPTVFYDNEQKMIFTRNNLIGGKQGESEDGVIKLKLYSSERTGDDSWGKPKELPFNSDEYSVGHPSISADEKTLYFVSDMPGGFGGTDLYKCTWNGSEWGKPENLGNEINSEGNEMFPFIHKENILYFSSMGHGGLGGLDVFRVDMKNPKQSVNLGVPINTQGDDFGFILSDDGESGYFSSNRKGGEGDDDIYHFRVKKEIIDVLVFDEETGEMISTATVELLAGETLSALSRTSPIGEVNFQVNPQKSYLVKVSKIGYSSAEVLVDTEQLQRMDVTILKVPLKKSEVIASTNSPKETTGEAPYKKYVFDDNELVEHAIESATKDTSVNTKKVVNTKTIQYYEIINPRNNIQDFALESGELLILDNNTFSSKAGNQIKIEGSIPAQYNRSSVVKNALTSMGFDVQLIEIKSIYYDFNKYVIRNDASAELDRLVNLLVAQPDLKVKLSAHTDSRGSKSYNTKLAMSRVDEAQNYLISEGIAKERIVTDQFGESLLANDCSDSVDCDELLHQQNRRTEIMIIFE